MAPEPTRIEFHDSLYDSAAVDAAVEAFGHLASFAVERGDHHVVVHVDKVDERVADRLVDALCNHVLFDTVSRRRAAGGTP